MRNLFPEGRPGWPEVLVGGSLYLGLLIGIGLMLAQIADPALRGILGMAANGVAGSLAWLAAWSVRIRKFSIFGVRAVAGRWLAIGAALGIAAFFLSFAVEAIYFHFVVEKNTQADFQAAARGGGLSLLVLLVTGALFTPFGEEALFRGVIANMLNRFGRWPGVVGSAAVFAAAHGFSVILLDAFMVGLLTGFLFRRTNSLWPGLLLHVVYNGSHLLYYSRS